MDKKHKDILTRKRPDLVENINIEDGLLTQLQSKKILTARTVKSIKAGKTPFDQVEELLDRVAQKADGFEGLCEALIADEQEHIVDLFLKPKEETKSESSEKDSHVRTDSQSKESQTVGDNPDRPQSSPPKLISHPTLDHHRLVQPAPSSALVPCQSIVTDVFHPTSGVQHAVHKQPMDNPNIQHVVHTQCTDNSVIQPIIHRQSSDNPSVQPIIHTQSIHSPSVQNFHQTSSQSHILSVSGNAFVSTQSNFNPYDFRNAQFTAHVKNNNFPEKRMNLKHYIDDPDYQEFEGMSPRTIQSSQIEMLNNNVSHLSKELIYVPAAKPVSLSREDTLDAMTKKPFGVHDENNEIPAKRQRREEVIEIPVFRSLACNQNQPTLIVQEELSRNSHQTMLPLRSELDDPDIDLTDGPVTVRVDHCTRQFYINNFKKSYAMRRIPRGKALIINVNEVEGKPPRRGTNIDRDNLHNLLTQLHFDVKVYNDVDGLTAQEMADKLEEFAADPSHSHGDSCFICLLSHGEEGFIFGTDGRKLQLDSVFKLFDNSNCKMLVGKPKIFVIQACRGGALDSGVPFADETDGSTPSIKQLPTQSDMIICFPTQAGYYAWRNRERGSWYIEALVQIFMKYAQAEDICTMLNRVNLLVSRKVSRCPSIEMDSMSQMSEYKSTLRMPHLYFYPGIGSVNG